MKRLRLTYLTGAAVALILPVVGSLHAAEPSNPVSPALDLPLAGPPDAAEQPKPAAPQLAFTMSLDNWGFSESAPLREIVWSDYTRPPTASGDLSFLRSRAAAGAHYAGYSIEGIWRKDWVFRYHPDTAEILYRDQEDLALQNGRDYRLDFRPLVMEGRGIRLGAEATEFFGVKLRLAASIFQVVDYQQGSLTGLVSDPTGSQYEGNAAIDYRYREDLLLDHTSTASIGQGYALDLGLSWTDGRYFATVLMEDLLSYLSWDRLPFTIGRVDTDESGFDTRDDVDNNAVFSGRRGSPSYNTTNLLPVLTDIEVGRRLSNWELSVNATHFMDEWWPALRAAYLPWRSVRLGAGYEVKSNRVDIDLAWSTRHGGLAVDVGTDNLDLDAAMSLVLGLSARLAF